MGILKVFDIIGPRIERFLLGQTQIMNTTTYKARRVFFEVTGHWPKNKLEAETVAQQDIDATTNLVCEGIKMRAAREMGIKVNPRTRK